jgi:hypothetical protein
MTDKKQSTIDNEKLVKKALAGKKAKPISAIVEATGLGVSSVRTTLSHMRDANVVKMSGNRRTAVYELA